MNFEKVEDFLEKGQKYKIIFRESVDKNDNLRFGFLTLVDYDDNFFLFEYPDKKQKIISRVSIYTITRVEEKKDGSN